MDSSKSNGLVLLGKDRLYTNAYSWCNRFPWVMRRDPSLDQQAYLSVIVHEFVHQQCQFENKFSLEKQG